MPANSEPATDAAPAEAPSTVSVAGFDTFYVAATAVATFLGAFLLFQVQPLIAGAILPWFGGTAAVWTTSLLFFQAALVAGYGYVALTHRVVPPRQRIVFQLALAAAALLLLPILPRPDQKPAAGVEPTLPILLLLTSCVGLPYFVLATTGPLLQAWFHQRFPERSPYRFYALSNFGSLCGLLTYPFIIEPAFDFTQQSNLWSMLFAAYAAALAACGAASWRSARNISPAPPAPPPSADKKKTKREGRIEPAAGGVSRRDIAVWLGLSAGGTLLLLTTTNYVSVDVAPDPLLWVLPLALYLLSFIVSFDHPRWYRPGWFAAAVLLVLPWACLPAHNATSVFPEPIGNFLGRTFDAIVGPGRSFLPSALANFVMLFAGCMLCHGELSRRRPEPRHLTGYYFCIAVGGALGGLFVAVIAPRIYNRYWEWFGAMLGLWLFAAAVLAGALSTTRFLSQVSGKLAYLAIIVGGALGLGQIFAAHFPDHESFSVRNVYGTISIVELREAESMTLLGYSMRSGTTQHGAQVFGASARTPTTYYSVESGVGTALMRAREKREPIRVGVVGLGVGTLATYGRPGDYFRFYEINPLVVDLAKRHFTFLGDSRAKIDIVLGDARLSLEAEEPQDFDLLVLDAFSSDAIPKHLLTREAFEVYQRHLDNEGILAIHVSNRFLNLEPLLAAAAKEYHLTGACLHTDDDLRSARSASRWVLLTRDPHTRWWLSLQHPGTYPIHEFPSVPLWTDAHNSIWPLLK